MQQAKASGVQSLAAERRLDRATLEEAEGLIQGILAGMADVGEEETTGADWEFPSKSVGIRMAVIAAGIGGYLPGVPGLIGGSDPIEEPPEDLALTGDEAAADRLWALSEEWSGETFPV